MVNLNESIGKRIAQLRHSAGMSQECLAKKLNCSSKHISHVERGVSSLSLDLLIEAADLFNCSLDYLVKGENAGAAEMIPPHILSILKSTDERMVREKRILLTYLEMYKTLREE